MTWIYIWTSPLKEAILGDYPHFTPTSNTVAYYPLKNDYNDYSGNWYHLSWVNNPWFANIDGVSCLDLSMNGTPTNADRKYLTGTVNWLPQWSSARTNMCWIRWNWYGGWFAWYYGTNADYKADLMTWKLTPISWGSYGFNVDSTITPKLWVWYHVAIAIGSGSQILYVNGVQAWSQSYSINTTGKVLYIGRDYASWSISEYISEMIFENRKWSATEIQNYFNLTKWNYWLS